MKPKRTDDKYWIGTRDFNHIQYESDLEDYIIDLENEAHQLRKHAVVGQNEQLICDTCKSGLIDYPDINRRTCRCGRLGYNVTD